MHAVQQRVAAEKARLAELQDTANRLSSVRPGSVSAQEVRKAQLQVEAQEALIEEANAQWSEALAEINKVELERLAMNAKTQAQTELARKKLALERTVISANRWIGFISTRPRAKRMLQDDPKRPPSSSSTSLKSCRHALTFPSARPPPQGGQVVAFSTDLLTDITFDGEVTRIMGEADLQRNTLRPRFASSTLTTGCVPDACPCRVLPQPGTRIRTGTAPTGSSRRLALFAPVEAMFDRAQDSARVWVVEDGRAQPRTLKLGVEEREQHLHVLEGLYPGDHVILPPHHKLKKAQRVKVSDPS